MSKKSSRESPPSEALKILSQFLDSKTIGIACCVNKTWWASLSSDEVWKHHLPDPLPFTLHRPPHPPRPLHKHIYAMGHVASLRGRSMGPPPPPRVAMGDIFFVDVLLAAASSDGLFHFEFDADPNVISVVPVEKRRADRLIVRWLFRLCLRFV